MYIYINFATHNIFFYFNILKFFVSRKISWKCYGFFLKFFHGDFFEFKIKNSYEKNFETLFFRITKIIRRTKKKNFPTYFAKTMQLSYIDDLVKLLMIHFF